MKVKKRTWWYFFILLIAVIILLLPFFLWLAQPVNPLNILIVDKTVPTDSYREHKGLMWILNHKKYFHVKYFESAIEKIVPYEFDTDYAGFFPMDKDTFIVNEAHPDSLDYDLLYVADTYGVYSNEFYGKKVSGERSELIYGGLRKDDLDYVENYLEQGGKTIIAEFNTFGSPTSYKAREDITDILGIKWSGWI